MTTCLIVVSFLLLALVAACSSNKSASNTSAAGGGTPNATASACPAHNTRHFAKTRFVADAALAGGAFKRYIYTPYEQGKFKKGADGRVKAIGKAVLAGAFVVNRLNAAKKNAEASPLLCKTMVAPIARFESAIKGLVAKGKSGDVAASAVTSSSGVLQQLHSAAAGAGAGFKDNTAATVG